MDINIDGRRFVWDDEKARINFQKHGIQFKTAIKVFRDEYKLVQLDYLHSEYEERWQVIGMVNDVLFVIYTERGKSTRVISARKATVQERMRYYVNRDLLFAERCDADSGRGSGNCGSEGF